VTRVKMDKFPSRSKYMRDFKFESPWKSPAALRVEALYGVDSAASAKKSKPLLEPEDAAKFKFTASATGVKVTAEPVKGGEHGDGVKFKAVNSLDKGGIGQWGKMSISYEHPFRNVFDGPTMAMGMWIKGDGSGATLNFQMSTAKIYVGCFSDHYVKLDFTGWRYFELFAREREAEAYDKDFCHYTISMYSTYRNFGNWQRVDAINVFLLDLPAKRECNVEIAQARTYPVYKAPLKGAAVSVNGVKCAVPFDLVGGDYAELDGGFWVHYSELGEPLERVAATVAPELNEGANGVKFEAAAESDRAEITVTSFGGTMPALKKIEGDEMKSHLAYEAAMPVYWDPSHGLADLPPVSTRPGETADLELKMFGPVTNPVVKVKRFFGWKEIKLPSLGDKEVRTFRSIHEFSGTARLAFEAADAANARVRLEFVKRYR